MYPHRRIRLHSERGVALLISLFALILISGVAISLIVMSGTESAINANYRRSTTVFYAAHAGLEEARERLVPTTPDTVRNDPAFPNPVQPVIGQMLYILNPAAADPAYNPQSDAPTSPYYDAEIQRLNEFGTASVPNPAQVTTFSPQTRAQGMPPLAYKWVRITLKNEQMAGVDMDNSGTLDTVMAVRVDGNGRQCLPSMAGCSTDPNLPVTTAPVYRITSFALDPTGARRMLQGEMAELPVINPEGAVASQAGVSINGNFNAFGAWPPIVMQTCGTGKAKQTIPTCGTYAGGAVQGDCNKPYDAGADTCAGVPRSHKDYCNQGNAVDAVTSAGNISAGNYDEVPDNESGCGSGGGGCIYSVSPQKALDGNVPDWPYDMDSIVDMFRPPITEPIQSVTGVSCDSYDLNGNRACRGQDVQIGTLPSTWPPPPNVQTVDNIPRNVFADVGKGGLLKLTGGSSGSGILIVEGDLEIQAGFQWYGLIIVRGVVTFLGGGATPTNVFGGILAGTSVTNATTTTGGSVSIVYSSCAYRFNHKDMPLRYLSFREIAQ